MASQHEKHIFHWLTLPPQYERIGLIGEGRELELELHKFKYRDLQAVQDAIVRPLVSQVLEQHPSSGPRPAEVFPKVLPLQLLQCRTTFRFHQVSKGAMFLLCNIGNKGLT